MRGQPSRRQLLTFIALAPLPLPEPEQVDFFAADRADLKFDDGTDLSLWVSRFGGPASPRSRNRYDADSREVAPGLIVAAAHGFIVNVWCIWAGWTVRLRTFEPDAPIDVPPDEQEQLRAIAAGEDLVDEFRTAVRAELAAEDEARHA